MVTIVIPGYSAHNKEWLEETTGNIKTEGEIRPIYWGHWSDPGVKFDPLEKAKLLDGISGKRVVNIVAKSIGTLVACHLIQRSPEKIRKVILCGIPLNDLMESSKETIKAAIKNIQPENLICFQNDEDPHGGFDALKGFLSGVGTDTNIVSKPRADHEYFYQSEFNKFLLG